MSEWKEAGLCVNLLSERIMREQESTAGIVHQFCGKLVLSVSDISVSRNLYF